MVPEPAHDGVGRRLQQEAVEGAAHLQRQAALQARHAAHQIEPRDLELREAHGVALVDAEGDVDVPVLPAHQRVHDHVHVAALPVQQQQADHVAAELELVEIPLLAESQVPDEEGAREPARVGRGDGGAERVIVKRVIALERKVAHHPLLLLLRGEGEEGRRRQRDEHKDSGGTQLTRSGLSPMLAHSRRTVNLFDT